MSRPQAPLSRRTFLELGSLALGGLTLADLLRGRAQANETQGLSRSRPTSVILIWLEGGPSHLETYDMKPMAPAEYRGEFSPIATNVPGLELCEHLPRHARLADRFSLIRSIAHDVADHPGAAGRFLTGRRPVNISDPVSKFPTVDAIVARCRDSRREGLPPTVSNVRAVKGGGTAYLGASYEPFVVDSDPNAADFSVQNIALTHDVAGRLDDRTALKNAFDRLRRGLDQSGAMEAGDQFHQQALQLLSSPRTRDAFDIHQEPDSVRRAYGRNTWGQMALLSRRLVEAGCSFVTVQMNYLSPGNATWDDHGDAQHLFNSMRQRLPLFDQAVIALIDDVYGRGLDQDVAVVVTGEFGRTPMVNMGRAAVPKWPGRDHWPGAMSVLVSGGGWTMGQAIGSTNSRGETPQDRRLDPNDLLASLYRFLGIDPAQAFLDRHGRPMPILPSGSPISELG